MTWLSRAVAVGMVLAAGAVAQVGALTLEAALKALPQGTDWQTLDLRFEAAVRGLEAARAATGLQLTADGSADSSSAAANGTDAGRTSSGVTVSASASLTVLPWSPQALAVRGAERALERADLERREARANLISAFTGQYFNARLATADLALANRNLTQSERLLEVAARQRDAGLVAPEALANAKRALEAARLGQRQAQGNLELARLGLANTLGPAALEATLSTAPTLPEAPQALEGLLARAERDRPDLNRARSSLLEAEEALTAAQTDRRLPGLSLSASYGQVAAPQSGLAGGPVVRGGLDLKSGVANVGVSSPVLSNPAPTATAPASLSLNLTLSIPILAPNADARVQTAQNAVALARRSLEAALSAARLDVRQKHLDATTSLARVRVAQLARDTATAALESAQARRGAGSNTALDLEAASIALAQSERDLEATIAGAYVAALNLRNATGDTTGGNP